MLNEITSKEHPLVKRFAKLRINRDFRHESRRLVIEGEKLVHDVLRKFPYSHLMVTDPTSLRKPYDSAHISLVSEEIMKKISGMEHPPKMMAEVAMPSPSDLKGLKWVIALDRLQDPGNLGTLFRTALALGWEGVYLIGDTVDPYNDKALRASQGASLILPCCQGSEEEFYSFIQREKIPLFVADLQGEAPKPIEKGCLVLGREGEGVNPSLKNEASCLTIPMKNEVESLNVSAAGAILMYQLRRP